MRLSQSLGKSNHGIGTDAIHHFLDLIQILNTENHTVAFHHRFSRGRRVLFPLRPNRIDQTHLDRDALTGKVLDNLGRFHFRELDANLFDDCRQAFFFPCLSWWCVGLSWWCVGLSWWCWCFFNRLFSTHCQSPCAKE